MCLMLRIADKASLFSAGHQLLDACLDFSPGLVSSTEVYRKCLKDGKVYHEGLARCDACTSVLWCKLFLYVASSQSVESSRVE
jgi:hypothetical protein